MLYRPLFKFSICKFELIPCLVVSGFPLVRFLNSFYVSADFPIFGEIVYLNNIRLSPSRTAYNPISFWSKNHLELNTKSWWVSCTPFTTPFSWWLSVGDNLSEGNIVTSDDTLFWGRVIRNEVCYYGRFDPIFAVRMALNWVGGNLYRYRKFIENKRF